MAHVSAEHLAGHALDLPEQLSAEELEHLAGCAECQDELATLRRVADLSRQEGTARAPLAPDPEVWARIQQELAADETPVVVVPAGAVPTALPAPTSPAPTSPALASPATVSTRRRPRRRLVLLAAAVGLVVGVAGTLGIARVARTDPPPYAGPPVEVIARTALDPLPGQTGSGRAELWRTSDGTELHVEVDAAPADARFHELWLINTDGKRMYSLGVLPASGSGTYVVPPALATSLRGYTIVDVSIEPYDGEAAHSRVSLVRGSLPA